MAAVGKTAGGNSAFKNFNNQFAHITVRFYLISNYNSDGQQS